MSPESFSYRPLTPAFWDDFVQFFGAKGACGGCWCMTWRLRSADYEKSKGEGNKALMKQMVEAGVVPGILAYVEGEPIGWCAIGLRTAYERLQHSRVLAPVDDLSVWAITCFFIRKDFRRKGVSKMLIRAALDFAKSQGAQTVEAYPNLPKKGQMPDVFAFTGIASTFFAVGFKEVARRSETRPIVRFQLS